jgi:hypothetical protein
MNNVIYGAAGGVFYLAIVVGLEYCDLLRSRIRHRLKTIIGILLVGGFLVVPDTINVAIDRYARDRTNDLIEHLDNTTPPYTAP